MIRPFNRATTLARSGIEREHLCRDAFALERLLQERRGRRRAGAQRKTEKPRREGVKT